MKAATQATQATKATKETKANKWTGTMKGFERVQYPGQIGTTWISTRTGKCYWNGSLGLLPEIIG